jgi:hypothetical protein
MDESLAEIKESVVRIEGFEGFRDGLLVLTLGILEEIRTGSLP